MVRRKIFMFCFIVYISISYEIIIFHQNTVLTKRKRKKVREVNVYWGTVKPMKIFS
jgi:hypothetical protein